MKAVILAAGEGTRLRPLTHDRPKPMLPVAGRPLLEHTIAWLRRHGVSEIAVNLHYCPGAITSHFGDGSRFGVRILYSHERTILGTAGALRRLNGFLDSRFAVVYGDVLTDLDLRRLRAFHADRRRRDARCTATLSLYRVANPAACGIVELTRGSRVIRMVEKPKPEKIFGDLAFSGVLIAEPDLLGAIPEDRFSDLGFHTLPELLRTGRSLYGLPVTAGEYLIDIGTPENYALVNREWPLRAAAAFAEVSHADCASTVSH